MRLLTESYQVFGERFERQYLDVFVYFGGDKFKCIPIDLSSFITQDHSPFFQYYYVLPLSTGFHVFVFFESERSSVFGFVGHFDKDKQHFSPFVFSNFEFILSITKRQDKKADIFLPSDFIFLA